MNMTHTLRYIALALLMGVTTACTAQNSSFKVTLQDFPQQQQLVLNEVVGSQLRPLDTLTANSKGEVEANVMLEQPAFYVLHPLNLACTDIHVLLLPKEKAQMTVKLLNMNNMFRVVSTKGSKNLETYKEFNNALTDSLQTIIDISNEFQLASTTDERKMALSDHYASIMTQQSMRIRNTLSKHKDCLISAFLVTYFDQDFVTYAALYEEIRDALKPKYPESTFVQHIDQKIATSLGPGMMAPEIAMNGVDGKELKLSSLRGKVVMIDFWASWCGPCRRENPNVVALYKKYHDAGFEIYSVSMDRKREDWVGAIEKDGLIWPNHVSDLRGWTSSGGASYGITSIPATVLVDRQGRIIAKNLRGADLERKLQEFFGF